MLNFNPSQNHHIDEDTIILSIIGSIVSISEMPENENIISVIGNTLSLIGSVFSDSEQILPDNKHRHFYPDREYYDLDDQTDDSCIIN